MACVHLAFICRAFSAALDIATIQLMFRARLTVALALLAIASVLEGVVAVWALGVADHHTQHGRVTADIHLGFVELSATKQRLRTWVSQALLGAGAAPDERMRLQNDLRTNIERLRELSEQAISLGKGLGEEDRKVQFQRRETLEVLGRGFAKLALAIDTVQPLPAGANAQEAWDALTNLFELSEGRNLRELIAENIQRAKSSVARERAAADRTLHWMRTLWLGTATLLAVVALLLAWYFAAALLRPFTELTRGAEALEQGRLDHRIPDGRGDEFSTVARRVNAMAAELKDHRQREADARVRLQYLVDERTSELRNALAALQEADERRRQLFADISHELRTPTTAIRGEAEVALRGSHRPQEDYRSALQRIVTTTRQLGLVIEDLLTMARGDIDALALQRVPIDPVAALLEAVAQCAALASVSGIRIEAQLDQAGGIWLLADAQRLRQLLSILLDNAVRYSHPHGRVSVSLQACADEQGRKHCEVCVVDQGIGIPNNELPRIFERNFRGVLARLHRADGAGRGLAIGAALARAHGGRIDLESDPGRGTIVRLRLPLLSEPNLLMPD